MMATKSKLAKSRQGTICLSPTPARASTETQWWALNRNNRVVKLSGLSKNPTTGGQSSASGGQLGKSLSRSRSKSEHSGRQSKTHCEICGCETNRSCDCGSCRDCCTCKPRSRHTIDAWLHKPIESYQRLFEYLVPALVEYGYQRS